MTDFNQDLTNALNGENNETINETIETQKIKLGETEYTQDELNEMVGFAKNVREQEAKYNTKFDKVWPEYSRSQTELKRLKDELDEARKPRVEVPQDQQAEIERARTAAKQLGILTKDDLKELGIVTKNEFDQYYKVQRATEKLLEKADDLEKELNGSDGRPAFKRGEILQFMNDTGIQDMNIAYKIKYESELDTWKDSKLAGAKKLGMSTIESGAKGGVSKEPPQVRITKDNLNQMMQEALEGKI